MVTKLLKKAIRRFMNEDLESASAQIELLSQASLRKKDQLRLQKILLLFMMGELWGLSTLHAILSHYGIRSNNYQKCWQQFSVSQIINMGSHLWKGILEKRLQTLAGKSGSTWSRSSFTIVIDGSVFKQWLNSEQFGKYYARYFSGQTGKVEYGFHVILLGLSIGEDFYPLSFHILRKDKQEKEAAIASKLLIKSSLYLNEVAEKHSIVYGKIYVSVDSGFRQESFLQTCERLAYQAIVGTPKGHLYQIGAVKKKLSAHIKDTYLTAEQAHKATYESQGQEPPPFVWRVKAYYCVMKRWVTLVFFRINGSKKVSVVFSTDTKAKGKTIRRRFFKRVQIEQFFRFIKHSLKIQQSTSKSYIGFLRKFVLYVLKAVYCLLFLKKCRSLDQGFKRKGFEVIRRHIVHHIPDKPLYLMLVKGTFCTDF